MHTESRELAVLFADIAGSTALYEAHGDAAARADIAACVEVMSGVVTGLGGRVVQSIGDEIMCVFDDPVRAALAAADLQGAVRSASQSGRFATGTLRVKVGYHWGAAIEEPDTLRGVARITAQQLIRLAKADQIITSGETLDALPAELRGAVRPVESVRAEAWQGDLSAFEMIWEVSGLTQISGPRIAEPRSRQTRMVLVLADVRYVIDASRPRLTLGRVEGNDVVIASDLVSRRHATVEFERGRFQLTDHSSNGTLVVEGSGSPTRLRGECQVLRSHGRISLGGPPEANPDAVLEFRCE